MNQKSIIFAVAMLVLGLGIGYVIGSKTGPDANAPAGMSETATGPAEDPNAPPHDQSAHEQSGMGAPPARVPVDLAAMEARLQANPNDVDALLSIIEENIAQGKAEAVTARLTSALELAKNNVPALIRLADAARKAGQGALGMTAAEAAIKKDPQAAEAYRIAGTIAWHDQQDNDKAIRYWTKFLELEPNAPSAEIIRKTIEVLKHGPSTPGAMGAPAAAPAGSPHAGMGSGVPVPPLRR